MSLIKIDHLSITYPGSERPVIRDLCLDIQKGEKVLILGASGSGKSTLALALNGMIPHAIDAEVAGTIEIDGVSLEELGTAAACRKIGILFQDPDSQFCMLHVEDEIAFGLENLRVPTEQMESIIDRSLQKVDLSTQKHSNIQSFSGGMKQKLGITCLYAMNPDIWILDEPTANLDPASAEEVLQLVMDLGAQMNKTIICIEHKLDLFASYMDRVVVLGDQGNIICDEPPRELFQFHSDELMKHGIWVPKICESARRLEALGMVWNPFPLTLQEWEQGIQLDFPKNEKISNTLGNPLSIHSLQEQRQKDHQKNTRKLLEFEDVSFSFKQKKVFENLSFDIHEGDFIAITGPNGAGKSTLTQLMIKLLSPTHGKIRLADQPMKELLPATIFRKIGYVFQNPEHQFVKDSVGDELSFGYEALGHSKKEWQPRVESLLEQFGLIEHRSAHPYQLSQGQKRRLSVATMLTHDQQLLILDEPTFGQDQAYTEAIMKILVELNQQGKTIVMITHDMELVQQYVKRVLLLSNERLAFQGNIEDFFKTVEAQLKHSDEYRLRLPVTRMLETSLRTAMELEVDSHA